MTDSVVDITQYKYDQAEKDLRVKLVEYSERPEIQSQLGEAFYIWQNDPDFSNENIAEDQIDELKFEKFLDWFLYDFKLLDTKERLVDRYYREEGGSLEEVEKGVIKDWLKNQYSFFEVEDVTPGEDCFIRDIFTKKQFQVSDRASSKQIKPSDIIGARPLKCGNKTYFSGVISVYPATFKTLITDFFKDEFKEYKKSYGQDRTRNDYLKDWGYQIGHFIEDVAKHPHFVTPEGDEFVLASASYKIKDRKKALSRIEKIKSLKEIIGRGDELKIFTWEKKGKNKITGTLEVEDERLHIECYSLKMLAAAKTKIEKDLHGLIEHIEDKSKKLDTFIDNKKDNTGKVKKYPLGVKNKTELDSMLDLHYEDWVDLPLQALGGQTPKEALKTKKGRDKLDSVINELEIIYEQAKKKGEPYYDIDKLRKKLKFK
jgi:hypothetical protein